MLEQHRNTKERWSGVSKMIDSWLTERQELIVRYYHLAIDQEQSICQHKLHLFCQLMIDYLSAGHFEVYEHLFAEGSAFQDGSVERVQAIPALIADSTETLLTFHDQLIQSTNSQHTLSQHLSQLGETLEKRFALEDRMVVILHDQHHTTEAC